MFRRLSCTLLLGLFAVGCSADGTGVEALEDDSELANVSQPVRDSDGPGDAGFAVGLRLRLEEATIGGTATTTGGCTGIALSPHWILTAAHCIRVTSGGTKWRVRGVEVHRQISANQSASEKIYDGNVGYKLPATWDDDTNGPETSDIGLIKLVDGAMSPSPRTWGRIFDDDLDELWLALNGEVTAAGWGLGNDDGSCTLSSLVPRTGRLSTYSLNSQMFYGRQDLGPTLCGGDSGGPWWGKLPGNSYALTWGISSRGPRIDCSGSCIGANEIARAVVPTGWIGWIEDATSDARLPLDCYQYSMGGWRYQRCYE